MNALSGKAHSPSKALRLFWAWKGSKANRVERTLNTMQAINAGRTLIESLWTKAKPAGVRPGDLAVLAVFCQKKNLGKAAKVVTFAPADSHADSNDLTAARDCLGLIPVGFIVAGLDRDSQEMIVHGRPLILQHKPLRLLESIVDDVAKLKGWTHLLAN